ncbi:MAG: hypothetical protein M3512_02990 [Bacteroidota bacterium]|nr:hypothetical protein [Bacteroidota bacterium]
MNKLSLCLIVFFLYACDSNKHITEDAYLEKVNAMTVEEVPISEEVLADIIQQIPSPLEISMLLKEKGTRYDKKLLNAANKSSSYNSNFEKALNLGIYGTDLGYTNIYEQNQDALFYLSSIKDLADGLSIGQFFDFGTIKRLATNSRNLDSLLLITTKNFNNINGYLQQQKRANLSILILTGGWLEALHITCQVVEKNPDNAALKERIGEQKIILENIMLLLSLYEKDPSVAKLSKEMTALQKAFSEIEIVYTYKESTLEEVNGMLMIKDNSTSKIVFTEQNLKNITKVTGEIRNKIIN